MAMNSTEQINHPYLKTLQSTLQVHYDLLERLTKRLHLIKNQFVTKTEHEQNEIEITIINTREEISALKKVIQFRENYFSQFMRQFVVDLEETEREYDKVLEAAQERRVKNPALDGLLNSVAWDIVETNIEGKIKLYQRLKKMIGMNNAQSKTKLKKV